MSTPPPERTPQAETGEAARRRRVRRRWKTLLLLASVSVAWKLIVLTLGAAVPKWLVRDGIDELPAELQAYGHQAKAIAMAKWSARIERHGVIRGVRVRVERAPDGADADRCGGLGARVRAYTYFAIPYSEVRTVCDSGVVLYRIFPRRNRGSEG